LDEEKGADAIIAKQPDNDKQFANITDQTITDIMDQLDGAKDGKISIPDELSLLPLRDWVIFPVIVTPLGVGRENSVRLVNESVVGDSRVIGVVSLKDPSVENPTLDDVYKIGTAVAIRMMHQLPDGIRLIVQGISRIEILEAVQTTPYLRVKVRTIPEPPISPEDAIEVEALKRSIGSLFLKAVALSRDLPDEMQQFVNNITDPGILTDLITAQMPRFSTEEKQKILETIPIRERMQELVTLLAREVQVLEISSKVESDVNSELGKSQRDYYLREQMKAIQKELGEGDDRAQEIEEIQKAIEVANLPEEALKAAMRELDRLQRMSPGAPEYTVSRTYIDWLTALPWSKSTEDNLDIIAVKETLDADHSGLEKVKDRILEYLSVRKFKADGAARQPILCFVGPPGVGKTSLGKSIAHALGKKFVRISLGGVRDEAEIRGHRRTYIGALPGQVIQGMRRAESNNPLFMLDEIDKVTADFRGDPSSALLEVLDPEQNSTFRDHYLEVPYDLSKVLFVTTANVLDTVSPPLRDRMEIIEIAGYTEQEKIQIAQGHLIPKQVREHGIEGRILFEPRAIAVIIQGHTREAGVRNLEREIANICRKATRAFAEGKMETLTVTPEVVNDYLGSPRFEREEVDERTNLPGVVTGLVWTPVGGDIIFIEATAMPSPLNRPSQLMITGQLGDVMKESAQAALSYVRAHAKEYGAPIDFYEKNDIHIHVPAGAIPKDGPSAGITMTTALASLFSGRPVKPRLAMTGEVTLSGKVLPIGGLKEKVLGAKRAGIQTLIIPERNRKDYLEDVPEDVRKGLTFHFVSDVKDVLAIALESGEKDKAHRNGRPSRQRVEKTPAKTPVRAKAKE
jgi:ATP-dependent Lon protease